MMGEDNTRQNVCSIKELTLILECVNIILIIVGILFLEGGRLMESIYSVAKYFLYKEAMTHKKLQKLCYFAQAWHLANYEKALVPNRFEAWVHGPVCPDLYSRYRSWGWETIPKRKRPPEFNDIDVAGFLDQVFMAYGDYDANTLENITHKEAPWINARKGVPLGMYCRNPISKRDMKVYYGERIDKHYD